MTVIPRDFADLLLELSAEGAQFVVVGGYAVSFHGYARATKDIDILVRTGAENATRVYRALAAFGAPLASFEVSEADFASYDGVLQIGVPPLRIDIITRIDGVTFADAVAEGTTIEVDGQCIPVIGRNALIRNKVAAGRPKDLADVAGLLRERRGGDGAEE